VRIGDGVGKRKSLYIGGWMPQEFSMGFALASGGRKGRLTCASFSYLITQVKGRCRVCKFR